MSPFLPGATCRAAHTFDTFTARPIRNRWVEMRSRLSKSLDPRGDLVHDLRGHVARVLVLGGLGLAPRSPWSTGLSPAPADWPNHAQMKLAAIVHASLLIGSTSSGNETM